MNTIWGLNDNFWELNPLFELHFKDIKDNDLSTNHKWSSFRMWCIALRAAPNSPITNMIEEEQLIYIYENYLLEHEKEIDIIIDELNLLKPENENKKAKKKKEKDNSLTITEKFKSTIFDNDLDAPLVNRYINVTHSKAKKLLRNWEDKLEEWQMFIDKTKVEESTYEMLGKMMVQSHTMWKQYYVIKKEADAELVSQGMGGAEKSFLEMEDY